MVFVDPKAWREGGDQDVPTAPAILPLLRPSVVSHADLHGLVPRAPDLTTYGQCPGPDGVSSEPRQVTAPRSVDRLKDG